MKNIKKTQDLVKEILMEEPAARNSDMVLYYMVCLRKNASALGKPFAEVIINLQKLNLPSIASVERARRKMQERYPNLASDKKVKAMREEQEEIYRKYSKGIFE